jgi:hypothetical protein
VVVVVQAKNAVGGQRSRRLKVKEVKIEGLFKEEKRASC